MLQQPALDAELEALARAPMKPPMRAAGADDAMAGHDDGNRDWRRTRRRPRAARS